jgi:uncharacterized membrane protein
MEQTPVISPSSMTPVNPGLVSYTNWIYALHTLSIVMGLFGSAFIVTVFIFGLPSIAAVIMNYARRGAVRGTWLESHFRWQIRTFWTAAIATLITLVVSAPFVIIFIGFVFIWIGYALIGVWIGYRVLRGWLALRAGRPMYA